jgi:hypothetical protein
MTTDRNHAADSNKVELTHDEKALTQNRAARKAAAEAGGTKLAEAIAVMAKVRGLEVVSLNALRAAGQDFIISSGREQLILDPAGMRFARQEILPHLPPQAKLDHIRLAVHLANILPEPIKTEDELRAVKREVQQMFTIFGLAEAPRRKELQNSHARNHYAEFVDRVASITMLVRRLEEEEPMENWSGEKLDEFLEDAAPIKRVIDRAERLRLGLVTPTP